MKPSNRWPTQLFWCLLLCLSVSWGINDSVRVRDVTLKGNWLKAVIKYIKIKLKGQHSNSLIYRYICIYYIYLYWALFSTGLCSNKKNRHCCRTSLCVSIFVTRPVIALFAQLRPAVAAVVAAVVVVVVVAAASSSSSLCLSCCPRPGLGLGTVDCGLWTELLQQCAFN